MRPILIALVVAPVLALAAPDVGQRFPELRAEDVNGQPQTTAKFRGAKTLVVAVTDRNATEQMRQWYETADLHLPSSVRRLSVISLELPFFIGVEMARAKAREQIPKQLWPDNLLDARGELGERLGISGGKTPWVFALDEKGNVLARFHGPVTAPGAEAIWNALKK
ncbi:MAG: redoxin family protein [Myxococcaceae bacterium]